MNTNPYKLVLIASVAFAAGSVTPLLQAQVTIYSDSFGGSGDLYGTAPDTVDGSSIAPGTVGSTWITYGNGSGAGVLGGGGWTRGQGFSDYEMSPTTVGLATANSHTDAFLPFTPVSGDSYSLTVNLKGNQGGNFDTAIGFTSSDTPNGGGGPNWGFNNDIDGAIDMGDNSEYEYFYAGGDSSVQNGAYTDDFHGSNPFSDPLTVTIDLTSTGADTWSASATAVDTLNDATIFSTGSYALSTNDIQYVGFYSEENVSKLQDFVLTDLTATVPEPSTWAMLGGGLFALLAVGYKRRVVNT